MGWLQSVGSALGLGAGPLPGQGGASGDILDDRFWGASATATAAGERVTSDTALQLDVVQAVLGRLSGTVSTLPLMVFERTDDAANGNKTPARAHPLYRVLHQRPNRFQTAVEFREQQTYELAWWRNCYARIHQDPATGQVAELEPIHPSRMLQIERRLDGRVYYTFSRLAPASGQDTYRDDEIHHIRKAPLTEDGLRGKYMWETSRETFGRAQAVETFGALFFKNGSSGGGVISHPTKFANKEEQALFLESWRAGSTGASRHRDKLLTHGVTFQALGVNNDEAQFLETLRECAVKVCRLWNMPPHMAGIMDKATFSNIEQQSLEFVVYFLMPWITAIEQAAGRDLLIGDDQDRYFVEYNVAGLMRGDFKTRMQGYAWGRQWGWLSVNDIRRMENQASIGPAGDVYLQPLNMSATGAPGADGGIGHNGGPPIDDPTDNPDSP